MHDFPAERQRLLDLGYEIACELYADGVDAAYFDTRATTGGYTEIHGDPPRILAAFASWRRAHELYRPGDPVIIPRPAVSSGLVVRSRAPSPGGSSSAREARACGSSLALPSPPASLAAADAGPCPALACWELSGALARSWGGE